MAITQQNHPGELLTIHQAAEFLQVSLVSLRRWTDSGRLKCYRIGAKRERRFRRDDLLAFLDSYRTDSASDTAAKPMDAVTQHTAVTLEGLNISYGSHLCSLYESDHGRVKLSVPFLAEGLRRRDVCYLVASNDVVEIVIDALRAVVDDVDSAVRNNQLRLSSGEGSALDMYKFFEIELLKATQSGLQSVRVLGDMAWFLDQGLDEDELIDFEIRYNHSLAHRFPVVSLCQFDARRFTGSGILNALKCHEDTFQYPLARFIGI